MAGEVTFDLQALFYDSGLMQGIYMLLLSPIPPLHLFELYCTPTCRT